MADMLPGSIILSTSILLLTLFHLLIIPVESNLVETNLDVDKNLLDLINSEGLTKFESFIRKADIQQSFKASDYTMTVFVFTDTAYFNLPPERKAAIEAFDKEEMKYFVKFFTVFDKMTTSDMIRNDGMIRSDGKNGNHLFTSVQSLNTKFDNTQQIYINGARIIQPDLIARNGIIHIIDNVLEVTSNNQAVEYLKNPEDSRVKANKFYELIKGYSAIVSILNKPDKLTLFVPTDAALENVDQKKLQQLKTDVKTIKEIVEKSMIKNKVLFTSFANIRISSLPFTDVPILYKNSFDQVSVISGDSTANIVLGNITIANGVIHMVDRFLGYVFNTVMEQIRTDSTVSKFVSFLSQININIINEALKTDVAVTLFVPTNEAFDRVVKQTEVLKHDTRCLEEIIKFHIVPDLKWQLVVVGGKYDTREKMRSMAGSYLKAYNFDYDRYVDGAGVKARLVSTDIGCTNGLVQKIDSVFGIPEMDIPSLICNHPWLKMQPFTALRRTGLQKLLTDSKTISDQSNNPFLPQDYGRCGFQKCDFTVLIPNGTAIEILMRDNIGKEIWRNTDILKRVMKRMIFRNECIFMESMAVGTRNIISFVGDPVIFQKSGLSQTVLFRNRAAKVLHSDLAATNGVVHIIDQVLWTSSDLEDYNSADPLVCPSALLMIISIILLLCMLL